MICPLFIIQDFEKFHIWKGFFELIVACNVLKCNVVLFTLWIIRSEITIFIFFKTAANKYKDKSVTLLLTDEIFVGKFLSK